MKVTAWRTWASDSQYQKRKQYRCRCNLTAWIWPHQCQSNSWELLYDKSQLEIKSSQRQNWMAISKHLCKLKGSTQRILCGIVLFKLYMVFSMCFACKRDSLVLILHIPTYLGIKGGWFFSDSSFFWWSFYVQIGVLQFVLCVQFNVKLNVTNSYVTNLY
jgi:hypothetical protein